MGTVLVTSSRTRIPALDGLRGVALLAVVACHSVWPTVNATFDSYDRVLVNGWIGVDLFFVLSGFLISGILIDTRDEPQFFRSFYIRRAFRIFPIYYLLLAAVFIAYPFVSSLLGHRPPVPYLFAAAHQRSLWTYTFNFVQARHPGMEWFSLGHLWSLSVEEQFYLVWPAVVLVVSSRRLVVFCATMCLLSLVFRWWWSLAGHTPLGAYTLTPLRMDSLCAGAAIAALARTPCGTAWLRQWYVPLGLVALILAVPLQVRFGSDLQSGPMIRYGYAANTLVFGSLLVGILENGRVARVLSAGWLRGVGRVSYGGYLYHVPLIGVLSPLRARLADAGTGPLGTLGAHAAWLAAVGCSTLAIAFASHRWIECPILGMSAAAAKGLWPSVRRVLTYDVFQKAPEGL